MTVGKFKLNDAAIDLYFRSLERFNTETKKKLIVKLVYSIEPEATTAKKRITASDLYEAWEDDRTAKEIIADIRNPRVNQRDTESFD